MPIINQAQLDEFTRIYAIKLAEHIKDYPTNYSYKADQLPTVVDKMKRAFASGNFINDTPVVKATCKHFEIKPTYKSIAGFLSLDKSK